MPARSPRTAEPAAPLPRRPRPGARVLPAPGQPHEPHRVGPAPRGLAHAAARSPPPRRRPAPAAAPQRRADARRRRAGQLPVDLSSGLRAAGTADVDHVAAHLAVSAGVQPDPVVAAPVRAHLALHQAPPDQPPVRAGDHGLASGLREPVGEPICQRPRRGTRQRQQALQMGQLRLRSRLNLVLLPAAQPLPEPGHRPQSHPQTKICRKAHPPLLLRLSTTHNLRPATGPSPGSTLPNLLVDRGLLGLYPAKRAALRHRRPGPGSRVLAVGGLILAHARALRPTAFTSTAFAGKATRELRRNYRSNPRSVVCVELCTIGTLLNRRIPGALSTTDPRRTKGTSRSGRSMISARTIGTHRKHRSRPRNSLLEDHGSAVRAGHRQQHDLAPAVHPRRRRLALPRHDTGLRQPSQHLPGPRRRAAQQPGQRRRPAPLPLLHRAADQLQPARRPRVQHHQQQPEPVGRRALTRTVGQQPRRRRLLVLRSPAGPEQSPR